MFTGIVEEMGTMKRIAKQGQAMVLTVSAKRILEDAQIGDSISVNGVCLTIIAFDQTSMMVDVMPETYRQTTLKQLHVGDAVNLERAMQLGGRFGGHLVQGHVDTTGLIANRFQEENAVVFTIVPDQPEIMKYIVSRGSITLDGISLTVVQAGGLGENYFTVSIIPHTLAQTVLHNKRAGDMVNIECDLLGKYVERLLQSTEPIGAENVGKRSDGKNNGGLTERFLSEHGYA